MTAKVSFRRCMAWCGALSLGLVMGGCRSGGDDDGSGAYVRLINAAPRAQDMAVAVDGKRVWRHSLFRSNTGFAAVDAGTYKVALEARQGGQIVSGGSTIACTKGLAYTVVTLGQGAGSAPEVRIFGGDGDGPVPSGWVRVRFVNALVGGTGEADLLFNNIAGLPGVLYGRRSGALLLQAGTYDIKVNAGSEVATLAGPSTLRLQGGRGYTLVAMGQVGATDPQESPSLQLYPDDVPSP